MSRKCDSLIKKKNKYGLEPFQKGLDHMGLIYASLNHLVFRLAMPAAVDVPPCICQTGLPGKLVLRVAKALVTL